MLLHKPTSLQHISTESAEYKKAVEHLFYCLGGQTFFTAQLFLLIIKADIKNRHKIAQAFPVEVCVYIDWMNSEDEKAFFAQHMNTTATQENEHE